MHSSLFNKSDVIEAAVKVNCLSLIAKKGHYKNKLLKQIKASRNKEQNPPQ